MLLPPHSSSRLSRAEARLSGMTAEGRCVHRPSSLPPSFVIPDRTANGGTDPGPTRHYIASDIHRTDP